MLSYKYGENVKAGEKVVFYDQGGRRNPRFCIVVKTTQKFLKFQQVEHDIEKDTQEGYVSSTHLKMYPKWDKNTEDKTFLVSKTRKFNIYSDTSDYIKNWYD
jgi:hypothetical protein